MTEAEHEKWHEECEDARRAIAAPTGAMTPERVEALEYALTYGWDNDNQLLPEAQTHRGVIRAMLDEGGEKNGQTEQT